MLKEISFLKTFLLAHLHYLLLPGRVDVFLYFAMISKPQVTATVIVITGTADTDVASTAEVIAFFYGSILFPTRQHIFDSLHLQSISTFLAQLNTYNEFCSCYPCLEIVQSWVTMEVLQIKLKDNGFSPTKLSLSKQFSTITGNACCYPRSYTIITYALICRLSSARGMLIKETWAVNLIR